MPQASEFWKTIGLCGLGVIAGVLAKVADQSTLTWASDLGTYPAIWVLGVALIGRFAGSWQQAVVRSAGFFLAMTIAYYGYAQLVLGFPAVRETIAWLAVAVTAVPATAAAVWWAAPRSNLLAPVIMAAVAALAGADAYTGLRQWWWIHRGELAADFPLHRAQLVGNVIVALVIAGLLPTKARTRFVALALLVPLSVAFNSVQNPLMNALHLY